MPALVEEMFYVSNESNGRFTPWHGMGTAVENAPTSADAIRLAGLDWTVTKIPMKTISGIDVPDYFANVRNSDNSVLGVVGNRYVPVQNADAFAFTDSLLGEGVTYETAGSLENGKRVWLLARMPSEVVLGDEVIPYLLFTNGHNGAYGVKVCMSNVRVVCNNTLNFALENASRIWTTRHVGDIKGKMEDVRETLNLAKSYNEQFKIFAENAANVSLNEDETMKAIETLFKLNEEDVSDRVKRNRVDASNEFIRCMNAPDIQKFNGTVWAFVNAASDFAYHSSPARVTSTLQEQRMKSAIDGNVFLNNAFNLVSSKVAA